MTNDEEYLHARNKAHDIETDSEVDPIGEDEQEADEVPPDIRIPKRNAASKSTDVHDNDNMKVQMMKF